MKKGNILIIGLICIANAGVVISAGNFSKKENAIEIKEKQKSNETNYFELYPTNQNVTTARDDENEDILYNTLKTEWQGNNTALMFKGESITQTKYQYVNGYPTDLYFYINDTPSKSTTLLNKWQITPYLNLNNVEETTKIRIQIKLCYTGESGAPNEQTNGNLKLKITTYTTTEDWSNYINQTNYYVRNNNNSIIEEIENPENLQTYTKKEEIKTYALNNSTRLDLINLDQEIEIITNNNETNYIFTYIQPYIENLNTTQGNYLGNGNGFNNWGYIWSNENNPIKISGYMLPPITDYEVIDIPGLMFNILTMPFSFISTAFNLTLFPGTPYQINLSNLILTVMAIFIFVFIIKKIFIK